MSKRNGRPHRRLDEGVHSVDAGRRVATSRSPVAAGRFCWRSAPGAPHGPAVHAAVPLLGGDGDVAVRDGAGADVPALFKAAAGVAQADAHRGLRLVVLPGPDEGVLDRGAGVAGAAALVHPPAVAAVDGDVEVQRRRHLVDTSSLGDREDDLPRPAAAHEELAVAVEQDAEDRDDLDRPHEEVPESSKSVTNHGFETPFEWCG